MFLTRDKPMPHLIAYLLTAALFVIVDLIWLAVVAKSFYRAQLQPLIADKFHLPAAGLFYALNPLGLAIFAVWPAMRANAWSEALTQGALFGFFAYMTYDLTNLATLRNWPLRLTVVDIAWGTLISGLAAGGAVLLTRLVT